MEKENQIKINEEMREMNKRRIEIGVLIVCGVLIASLFSSAATGKQPISLSKEEKEALDLLNEEDRRLLTLSEDEQVSLALKNSSEIYRLKAERSITLKNLYSPALSAEYGHEIIDRDRLDNIRRGQEEATYWLKYDFMDIFDNLKRSRSYNVEKETSQHKIRCDVRELRGKIRLTEQQIEKARNDYAHLQKNYQELLKQIIHPPDKQQTNIRYSQDSLHLYLLLKNAEQELLGYQYALISLIRGYSRVGYIK